MSEAGEGARLVARQLHAIASPVRLELMETLRLGGVLSTAELARRVPDARGGIQATLSDMAEAGWVRHEEGRGRAATWTAVENPVRWSDIGPDDEAIRVAQTALEQAARQRRFAYIRAFEHEEQTEQWTREWSEAMVSRDYVELLTPEELTELEASFHAAVVDIRTKASQRRETEDSQAAEQPVFLTIMAFPRRSK